MKVKENHTKSTERNRALRERRKLGIVMTVPVEVFDTEVDMLMKTGLINSNEFNDRRATGRAIETILEDWASREALKRRH